MRKKHLGFMALALLVSIALPAPARAQTAKISYPAMAPLERYLMAEDSEIALARGAAPASISGAAEVMVLKRDGYTTAVKGTNGFVCIVERAWASPTDDPEFWNPKARSPNCFNAAAARTFLPIFLMKTKLVLAGKQRSEILKATASALDKKELPALEPGAMCYMMSREQYLNDEDVAWHPHMMFFVAGEATKSWGAGLPGSPILAASDPEERVTIFMVVAPKWSDGTPFAAMTH